MSGLFSGMNACVSGLQGISQRVNCHSQNIASAGAIGAKERQAFMSVINSGSSIQAFSPGGVTADTQHFITEVGSTTQAEFGTYMALTGQGFFVVNNIPTKVPPGQFAFTRVGTFAEDKNGNFVNHAGQFLQILATDPAGVPLTSNTSSLSSLVTASSSGLSGNPTATTTAVVTGLLDATAAVGATKAIDMQVYDSLGVQHDITLTFTRTVASPQTWTVAASSADASAVGAPYAAGMSIVFDVNGLPQTINGGASAPNMGVTWLNSAAPSSIAMSFGAVGQANGVRAVGTGYDFPLPQTDGRGPGKYIRTDINTSGQLIASFDNNSTIIYGQIPLATFADANQLLEKTGGVFIVTADSGAYTLNNPNQGNAGGITPSSYEESTIDTAAEFTNLIVDQQRYTANLRGITTIEDILKALDRAIGA